MHLDPGEPRVRPREVDVLEDAERAPPSRERLHRVRTVGVHAHDLARTHVTDELGADDVERARLRRDDPVVAEPAELERAEAERVAECHEERRPRSR